MIAHIRVGVTLVELIVSLSILGLLAGVVGIAIPRHDPLTAIGEVSRSLADARRTAITSGHAVTIAITIDGAPHAATALPDGAIIADSGLAIDRLSGALVAQRPADRPGHAP
jgi:prepilin-type N-terminal cleavage/methylation domain-containing protein